MLTAWYIGDHRKDGLSARIGTWFIRLGQIGQRFGHVVHCEAILVGTSESATIASASLRDGGVRIKTTALNKEHWVILDVPVWDAVSCADWFERNAGKRYSMIGAASSASPFVGLVLKAIDVKVSELGQWCSRSLAEACGVAGSEDMSVSELMALAVALPGTIDVTEEFFKGND